MSNIVSIIRSAIETGSYDLSSMLETIAYHQAHGDMTLEEMEELTGKARENAKTQYEPDSEFQRVWYALHELEQRVAVLEGTPEEAYPPYDPNTTYFAGDRVTFEGQKYDCVCDRNKGTKFSPSEKPKDWQLVEVA